MVPLRKLKFLGPHVPNEAFTVHLTTTITQALKGTAKLVPVVQ